MTNNLQALYDILGEAFNAGKSYVESEFEGRDVSAASLLFPLAARMEEGVKELIEAETEACVAIAVKFSAYVTAMNISKRFLPSSPERET